MTTPTTNLLEWIDDRMKWIESQSKKIKPFDAYMNIRTEELKLLRARILQEVENEKEMFKKVYLDGSQCVMTYDGVTPEIICEQYYQTTFKPNNDEQNNANT